MRHSANRPIGLRQIDIPPVVESDERSHCGRAPRRQGRIGWRKYLFGPDGRDPSSTPCWHDFSAIESVFIVIYGDRKRIRSLKNHANRSSKMDHVDPVLINIIDIEFDLYFEEIALND